MSNSITLWASLVAIFAFCAFCYGCFGGLVTHFDLARWSLLFQSQSSVQQASRRQQFHRRLHQAERDMNQARRRQREVELADQNAAASPIPAPSNFLEERRTFYQMRNHDAVLSLEDLELLIPSGTVVKDEDSASGENRLAVDFGNDGFSCIDDNHDHCNICLEDWKDGDQIRRSTFCTHVFHSECMFSWMKQSHECPSCRTRVLPEGYTVNLVGEEYEEVNNSNWDSVGIPSGRLPPGAMTATTHFLQYGTETTNNRNNLFPSFLPMEQRRTFLEDLLIVGVSDGVAFSLGRFELFLTLFFCIAQQL